MCLINDLVLAHSDQGFIDRLVSHLTDRQNTLCGSSTEGFDALKCILKHNPKLVIIEADLSNLNASDIIKCISKKGRTTIFIVIVPDETYELPCATTLKSSKGRLCTTQIFKTTLKHNDFSPIFQLINSLETNKKTGTY